MKSNVLIKSFATSVLLTLGAICDASEKNPQIQIEGTGFDPNSSVCAGEIIVVKGEMSYPESTCQWYMNGKRISGANSNVFTFETSAEPSVYEIYQEVSFNDGQSYKSNVLEFNTKRCCDLYGMDGEATPASQKIIFKEDFGEIDLSDPTGKTYKVWDYSDITNPKQVVKKTTTPFRYELDEAPLGCTYSGKSHVLEGEYTVAGVLTGYVSYDKYEGARLEWANRIGGVKMPSDPGYDHSGKIEGCCLFVNAPSNTKGKVIYAKEVTGLCPNLNLELECFISVFTNAAMGPYNPVDVIVRLTEIGNESNTISVRGTTTIEEDGGEMWKRVAGELFLETDGGVRIEILSNTDVSDNGNDLVIDDIRLKMCTAPSLQSAFKINDDFDSNIDSWKEDLSIAAIPTKMLVDYCGGKDNISYLYQWTLTPEDKTSWKRLADPTDKESLAIESVSFAGIEKGEKVYFRSIASSRYVLEMIEDSKFNSNDPCANYSVSNTLTLVSPGINCPSPVGSIKINADSAIGSVKLFAEANSNFESPAYHWNLDGKPVLRADSGPLELDADEVASGTVTVYAIDINGCSTDTLVYDFEFSPYCTDENGNRMERILVWQENFGEIDMSDTTGKTYKVWDYSDLSNPVQITKKTTTPFRYELDEAPLGCTYSGKSHVLEGEYTVAGVLTGYVPYGKYEGARLEWANRIGGVKIPSDPGYDHSGKIEGCCLFVNAPSNTKGKVIYAKYITDLCVNSDVAFECFISVFTNSSAGPYNPVDVIVRLTEIGNESNTISVRGTTTIEADGGEMWKKVAGELSLKGDKGIKIEILSNTDVSDNGNDLVIDDIKLFTCCKGVQTNVESVDVVSADSIVNVYSASGALIKSKVKRSEALSGLEDGVYLVGGEKVVVKK